MTLRMAFLSIFIGLSLSSQILASTKQLDGLQVSNANITGSVDLAAFRWQKSSNNCKANIVPAIMVVQADSSTYVLRQSKCTTFEAPFMYLLIGSDIALLLDSGDVADSSISPLHKTIREIIDKNHPSVTKLLLVHSHSHRDHTRGDAQFVNRAQVEIVSTNHKVMIKQLDFKDWPNQTSTLDLGGRVVSFIPTPGHQDQSIAIYDARSDWLLSGDSLYPGLIRIKNWNEYRASIARLVEFSTTHPVSHILGAHIEINASTGTIYKIGTIDQPEEAPLALQLEQLLELNEALKDNRKPKTLKFPMFTIKPLSWLEKSLSKGLSLIVP